MKFSTTPPRLADSLPGGLINGVINGVISWSAFKGSAQVPLSVDSIAAPGVTALGNAATVAFALTDSLVFSASVEKTDNAHDDGAVLGRYLGLLPLSMLKDGATLDLTRSAQLITKADAPVATKVESIVLTHTDRGSATGVLLSDNDDGSSGFFQLMLTLRPTTRPQSDQLTGPRTGRSVP